MSLTGALNASRSGLAAVSRWSDATAGNVANANTEGYVRREVTLTTRQAGSGTTVAVTGVSREVDASLQRMHRGELSRAATQDVMANGLENYTTTLGRTDDAYGLSSRVSALQTALGTLSVSPGETGVQRSALEAAEALAGEINGLSATLDRTGDDVTARLSKDVAEANELLGDLATAEERRRGTEAGTAARAAVDDEIDRRLDALSGLMDISVSRGSDDRLNVQTGGGTPLIQSGVKSELSFDVPTGTLTADGVEITPGREGVRGFSEGAIAGRITLLNDTVPRFQRQLDEMARGLIEDFTAADSSLPAGAPGLFTDGQGAFDPAAIDGLAGRLAVNDAARPEAGGALWRMRDGMGAAAEGPAGDSTQALAFVEMMESPTDFSDAAGLGSRMTLGGFAADLTADQQVTRTQALDRRDGIETRLQAFGTARQTFEGVNVDDELQQLMLIEQSYAANSKIMTSVAEMIDTLLAAV